MIRATLTIDVRPGHEPAFECAWRAVAAEVRGTPGHLRQALLRDPAASTRYVVSSDWESADAFRAFERSPAQEALTAPLRALRTSASMTVHDLLVHLEGEPCPHE